MSAMDEQQKEKSMSKTLKEQTYYIDTYLAEKEPDDTRCTLFIRHFRKYQTPSGRTVTAIKLDVVTYATPEDMADVIKHGKWLELPKEADGNPMYVPEDFEADTIRKVTP
jgi:hypothetical protein